MIHRNGHLGATLIAATGEAIRLTVAGDAIYEGDVVDLTEARGIWEETLIGSMEEWQEAISYVDSLR